MYFESLSDRDDAWGKCSNIGAQTLINWPHLAYKGLSIWPTAYRRKQQQK